ncbi:unnamed protein product [Amoebophrya sp. A25]|nr:unnamed protein product [Amoebophrya sp. A25]|eukprot:GSA25T00003660001.1
MIAALAAKKKAEAEKAIVAEKSEQARFERALTNIWAPGPKMAISGNKRLPWQQTPAAAARALPYFQPPARCTTGSSSSSGSTSVTSSGIVIRKPREVMTAKRRIACEIASDSGLLGAALGSLENLLINKKSNAVANSRLRSYEMIIKRTALCAWPASEASLYTFIGIAVAAEYSSVPEIVSDVLAASPQLEDYIGLRTREVIARLRRKGVFGDRTQKQALTLAMISKLPPGSNHLSLQARLPVILLVSFFGALRKSEAAAVAYGPAATNYVGLRFDVADNSLVLDFSLFKQKGGIKCARVTRIFCACCDAAPAGKRDRVCLIHNPVLRECTKTFTAGGMDTLWAIKTLVRNLKLSQAEQAAFATHSCRVGCAVHLFSNEIMPEQIIHHARWSDTTMLFYYARNSKKNARPAHWTNSINWIKNSQVAPQALEAHEAAALEDIDYENLEFCT